MDTTRNEAAERAIDTVLSLHTWATIDEIGRHFWHRDPADRFYFTREEIKQALTRMISAKQVTTKTMWRGCFPVPAYKRRCKCGKR